MDAIPEEEVPEVYVDDLLEMLNLVGVNEKCFREAATEKLRLKEAPISLKTTRQEKMD